MEDVLAAKGFVRATEIDGRLWRDEKGLNFVFLAGDGPRAIRNLAELRSLVRKMDPPKHWLFKTIGPTARDKVFLPVLFVQEPANPYDETDKSGAAIAGQWINLTMDAFVPVTVLIRAHVSQDKPYFETVETLLTLEHYFRVRRLVRNVTSGWSAFGYGLRQSWYEIPLRDAPWPYRLWLLKPYLGIRFRRLFPKPLLGLSSVLFELLWLLGLVGLPVIIVGVIVVVVVLCQFIAGR